MVHRDRPLRTAAKVGICVFGSAYAPFDAPGPDYPAPGALHITGAAPEHLSTREGVGIDPRSFFHPLDLEVLARQLRFIEDVVRRAAPLTRLLKPYTKRFTSLEATKDYVRDTADGAYYYTVIYAVAELGVTFIMKTRYA
ncbi:putative gmc oxidoreductase [Diaporthe ampelina]|uniref:Putative gmc oxidoreductase n=1 Tax=Diaporthe ampelina TaxID=1214573 RepID=A0A0G2H711_9PEZI|nr:putative gmc oxidoreductase [Diaporthe ampelina]